MKLIIFTLLILTTARLGQIYSIKYINNTEFENINTNKTIICYYLNLFCSKI
jgi:hypothetical protein